MSQFMLFVSEQQQEYGIPGIEICPLDEADEFLKRAGKELLSARDLQLCWYPLNEKDRCTDTLFTDAQRDIVSGVSFNATRLGMLLNKLVKTSKTIILWYGNDWSDLLRIENRKEFIALVESQLFEDSGEIYLQFHALDEGNQSKKG